MRKETGTYAYSRPFFKRAETSSFTGVSLSKVNEEALTRPFKRLSVTFSAGADKYP